MEVKFPAIYKHFKHTEDGIINNYLYCTLFISTPTPYRLLVTKPIDDLMKVQLTELGVSEYLYLLDGKWCHKNTICNDYLVIYKSLYDNAICYARPIEVFTSKVDKQKYKNIKQEYRFELISKGEI